MENKKVRQRKFNDLSGKKVNQLTVLHRIDNKISNNGHVIVMYRCICDCGKEIDVRATSLKSGSIKSCGCSRRTSLIGVNLEDLTGQQFGRWTVLSRADSVVEPSGRKATMWHCRCQCGFEKDLRAHSLKNGTTLSCGCLKSELISVVRDLTGQQFGRWLVVNKADDVYKYNRKVKMWHCKCQCGTEKDVSEQSLIRGKSVSCGCYRKEQRKESATYVDLTGQQFGNWTVLSRADDRFYPGGGRAQMWNCRCVCGQEHIVAGNMLKSGISQSCGCLNQPIMELHVRQYLDDNNWTYESQKMFDDLVGVKNGYLSYDFLVYKDNKPYKLIECQGEQHYRPVDYFGGQDRFDIQCEHDKRKLEYAKSIGLELIVIDYRMRLYDTIAAYLDIYL